MSNAIALASQPLSEQWKYAQALAQAGLLPKQYRDSPGDVLLAMAYAESLGLPVAQIFTGIHVIEGRPSMSAELMGALVRRAGHRIRMSGDSTTASAEIVRRDDPEFTYRATFTIEDAKQAGLLGKDVWKKYPAAMLLARAVSAVCRAGAGDVLAGVSYVPEELGEAPDWIEEAPVVRLKALEPDSSSVTDGRQEQAPEPPKRRRRTKAEMDEARRLEQEAAVAALDERMADNEARLAGPSDPEGEERQETAVAEANTEAWVADWLVDLEQAIEAKDLGAVSALGTKAANGNRRDLVAQAREAWSRVQQAS
jgi:hypothetical protein